MVEYIICTCSQQHSFLSVYQLNISNNHHSDAFLNPWSTSPVVILVVGEHVIEGVVEFIRTLLDLQLLSVDLILNVINPLVELGDVHLSVLESGLGDLVLVLQGQDLLHKLLLSLQSLLSRLLQLLHVLTHSLQLLLDALISPYSNLASLQTSLQLGLLDSQLPAQLIKLLLVVNSHLDGGPEVLVQLLNGDLIVEAGVLNNLDSLEDL